MKILMITPYLPFPLVSGGQIRTYNLLKNLSRRHQITLYSFIRNQEESQYINKLKPFCEKIVFIKRRSAWSLTNIILAGFTFYPFLVCLYLSRTLRGKLKTELASENYDLIHAETFYVMPNIPQTKTPIILVEQVIEFLVYQKFIQGLAGLKRLFSPLLWIDVLKIKYWEKHYWIRASRLATMSNEDKHFIHSVLPDKYIDIVANGVDSAYFARKKKRRNISPTVLFVGNFKWLPNVDAAKFLVRRIWPLIVSRLTHCRLIIVGRHPSVEITALADDNIEIIGELDDIRDAFAQAHVLLAPIRNGRGTKYKVLEAMATHTPVVGTPLAVEGLGVVNGTHTLVATSAVNLADNTINVLTKPKLSAKLARNGHKLVTEKFDWSKISEELDLIYRQLGEQKT